MEQTKKFYKVKANQPGNFLVGHYKKILGAALLVLPFFIVSGILNWYFFGRYGFYDSEISERLIYSLPAYLLHYLAFVIFFRLLNGILKIIHSGPKTKISYAAAFSAGKFGMRYLWLPVFSVLFFWFLFAFISTFLATAVVVLFMPLAYIAALHKVGLQSAFERMREYLSHPDFKKQLPFLFIAFLISLVVYIVLTGFFRFFYSLSGWYVSVIIVNILIRLVELSVLGYWYIYVGRFYALHMGFDSALSAEKTDRHSERKNKNESKLLDVEEDFIPERSDKRKEKPGRKEDKSDPDYNRFEHWDDEVKF
jgi:hypothetical protein